MKLFPSAIAAAILFSGSAAASSLVTLAPDAGPLSPSVVEIGPEPKSSPSVITRGTASETADSAAKPLAGANWSPMVIRGGIVGEAFAQARPAAPTAVPASPAEPQKAAAPSDALPAAKPAAPDREPEPAAATPPPPPPSGAAPMLGSPE